MEDAVAWPSALTGRRRLCRFQHHRPEWNASRVAKQVATTSPRTMHLRIHVRLLLCTKPCTDPKPTIYRMARASATTRASMTMCGLARPDSSSRPPCTFRRAASSAPNPSRGDPSPQSAPNNPVPKQYFFRHRLPLTAPYHTIPLKLTGLPGARLPTRSPKQRGLSQPCGLARKASSATSTPWGTPRCSGRRALSLVASPARCNGCHSSWPCT